MKSQDFAASIRALDQTLALAGSQASGLSVIVSLFEPRGKATVASVVKLVAGMGLAPMQSGQPSCDDIARLLRSVRTFVATTSKSAILADLEAVAGMLSSYGSVSSAYFATTAAATLDNAKSTSRSRPMREDLIASYYRRLEECLGDDRGFRALADRLNEDAEVGKAEAIALAKRFTQSAPKSRAEAIKKIRARHQALMNQRAKLLATDGRSAA